MNNFKEIVLRIDYHLEEISGFEAKITDLNHYLSIDVN